MIWVLLTSFCYHVGTNKSGRHGMSAHQPRQMLKLEILKKSGIHIFTIYIVSNLWLVLTYYFHRPEQTCVFSLAPCRLHEITMRKRNFIAMFNCPSNVWFEKLGGHLGEIVTVSVHKTLPGAKLLPCHDVIWFERPATKTLHLKM